MNDEQLKKINLIFQSLLGDSDDFTGSSAKPIESIIYVELLITLQNEFKIKFSTQEFVSLRSVGNIRESVSKKISEKSK